MINEAKYAARRTAEKGNPTDGRISRRNQEAIKKFRLMDDDFMRMVLEGDKEAAEEIVRTILAREDIHILEVTAQREYIGTAAGSRTIIMDIQASDSAGEHFDIEIQRDDRGAIPRRARMHSSALDSKMLRAKEKFRNLKDSYVIFITEHDIYDQNLPLYHVERQILEMGIPFWDGSHIIFANGAYQNDADPVGRLMHDFRESDPDKMFSALLAERTRYFKEQKGGRASMSRIMDEIREEGRAEGREEGRAEGREEGRAEGRAEGREQGRRAQAKESAGKLRSMGLSIEQIAGGLGYTADTIEQWLKQPTV